MKYLYELHKMIAKLLTFKADTICGDRISFLDTWFSTANIFDFINFRCSLCDNVSIEVFDKLVYLSLSRCFGRSNGDEFHFYTSKMWAEIENKAKSIDCFNDSYLLDIVETFVLEGYNYNNLVCANQGDTVLDCGAYTGNTSLYFSKKVGTRGKVFSFEPTPGTFQILEKNIHQRQLENVFPYNLAIEKNSGEVKFLSNGGAGNRANQNGDATIKAVSIDDFISSHDVDKVNFIKMDIEGAELSALQGAVKTLQNSHPDLAICIYHRVNDFIDIPKIIKKIVPGYRFYLRHNSNSFWETVLFAKYDSEYSELQIDFEECSLIASWWKGIRALVIEKIVAHRMLDMKLYDALLRGICKLPIYPIFAPAYEYVYYPVSPDKNLHYEFLNIRDKNYVEISLHFEGKYEKMNNVIQEICDSSRLNTPLNNNSGRWKGCSYLLIDASDHLRAATMMNYLINISLPILKSHKMLDDRFFL